MQNNRRAVGLSLFLHGSRSRLEIDAVADEQVGDAGKKEDARRVGFRFGV